MTPMVTHNMKVYLGKNKQHKAQDSIPTHATVTELPRKVGGRGHK
jgi:hypothetical protein